jgi:hypothetical protein
MLPDFRFALGALLAITLIAVAGLGLVTSVRLAREARIGPLDDSRSLAYAGHAEWNQFYDPDGARRFEGLAGKTESPVAEPPRAPPPEAAATAPAEPAPAAPEERTASLPSDRREPTDRREPEIAPVVAPIIAAKPPETDPPKSDPPPETAPAAIAALPAEPASAPAPGAPVPVASAPDAPAPSASAPEAPPAERVASAPATLPEPALAGETRAPAAASIQPQAGGDAQADPATPTPRARPKFHFHKKVVRLHIHHPVRQQSAQSPGIPASNAPWPGYDNQFTGTAARKNGALASRPQ